MCEVATKKKSTKKALKKEPVLIAQKPEWYGALQTISSKIFKIKTPRGHGTGFHVGDFGTENRLSAVATALHVVDVEEELDGNIRLEHKESGRKIMLKKNVSADGVRVIFTYPLSDLAIIVFERPKDFKIEGTPMDHLEATKYLKAGVEVGWCGFPGLMREQLCFFHGYISCSLRKTEEYLVDGVAINGVSGGPVFYWSESKKKILIAGVITAYLPNRSLPGLSMIASVSPYEKTIKFLKNIDEAKEESEKQKEEQKDTTLSNPVPPPSSDKKDIT